MIFLLPLLRRFSVRNRARIGAVLAILGLVAVAVGLAAAPAIVIPASVTVFVGAVFLGSARRAHDCRCEVAR